MKQKLIYGLIAVLLTGSALFAMSYTNDKAPTESATVEIAEGVNATMSPEMTEALAVKAGCACSGSYWPGVSDTITTTEIDTLPIAITFESAYIGSIHGTFTTLSGTRAAKVYYDESNALSGATGWVTMDSMTVAVSPANEYVIKRDNVYGRKARLRIKGATGTFKYTVNGYFKYQ